MTYGADSVWNYELGEKARLADGRVTFNSDAYFEQWQNVQSIVFLPARGEGWLARQLTGLTVIGTASRPRTAAWVRDLGAHHVIDHAKPLAEQTEPLGAPGFVFCTTQTDKHVAEIAKLIAPQGRFALPSWRPDRMALHEYTLRRRQDGTL